MKIEQTATRSLGNTAAKPVSIADQLRAAIWDSGKTSYRLGLEAGVAQPIIDRFLARQQDLRLSTAAKIAEALDWELRPRGSELHS
jgi:predicted transcriptional regulator